MGLLLRGLGDVARCRELGVSNYLTKPVRRTELRKVIAKALAGHLQNKTGAAYPIGDLAPAKAGAVTSRILLAEDNSVNQQVARRILQKRGYSVVIANNGVEALQMLERQPFDLILMDVQMPQMDGFEATAVIRETEKVTKTRVPIIALTAHAIKGDKERCLAAGMDGYISKPIRGEELLSLVEHYSRKEAHVQD